MKILCLLALSLALCACKVEAPVNIKSWMGQWQGVEGTKLEISREGTQYKVMIQDLDGQRNYDAEATDHGLSFTRDGVTETIHPGTGLDTGMKWLTDKHNCLVIKMGEGYCRD